MTQDHKHARLYQIFTKDVVRVCQFALEFANPLGPQYTRDFKIKVFLGLFHNFDAASFKQFHKKAIYSEVQGLQLGLGLVSLFSVSLSSVSLSSVSLFSVSLLS